jgi:hypothetical protein
MYRFDPISSVWRGIETASQMKFLVPRNLMIVAGCRNGGPLASAVETKVHVKAPMSECGYVERVASNICGLSRLEQNNPSMVAHLRL